MSNFYPLFINTMSMKAEIKLAKPTICRNRFYVRTTGEIHRGTNVRSDISFSTKEYSMNFGFKCRTTKYIMSGYAKNIVKKLNIIENFLSWKPYYALNMNLCNSELNIAVQAEQETIETNIINIEKDNLISIYSNLVSKETTMNMFGDLYNNEHIFNATINIENKKAEFTQSYMISDIDFNFNSVVDIKETESKRLNLYSNINNVPNINLNQLYTLVKEDKQVMLNSTILNPTFNILGSVTNNYAVIRDVSINDYILHLKKGFNSVVIPITYLNNKHINVLDFMKKVSEYLNKEIYRIFELATLIKGDEEFNFVIMNNNVMSNPQSTSNFKLVEIVNNSVQTVPFIVKSKIDVNIPIKELFK